VTAPSGARIATYATVRHHSLVWYADYFGHQAID
jgi:hypothetical protein